MDFLSEKSMPVQKSHCFSWQGNSIQTPFMGVHARIIESFCSSIFCVFKGLQCLLSLLILSPAFPSHTPLNLSCSTIPHFPFKPPAILTLILWLIASSMILYSFPNFYGAAKSYNPLHPDEGVDMAESEAVENYSKTVSAHNRAVVHLSSQQP